MAAHEVPLDQLEKRLSPLGVSGVRPLSGGASSLTYLARAADGGRVVVKVAPAGVEPVRNRDVLRQARVIRALAGTGVPVPEVVWEDRGEPPEVPPLFVTSFVEGASFEPLFDPEGPDEPAVVAGRMTGAARVLARLHRLDPARMGLEGETEIGLGDEIDRWCRLLETVDATLAPGWEQVAQRLRAATPAPRPAALVHGDFRLGNLLAHGPEITAVIDWEIWALGDPRVDLGWFLVNADPTTYGRPSRYAGTLPGPDELAAIYGEVPDRAWFEALACFKSTATWSLIVKHNRRRSTPDPDVESLSARLPLLLERAIGHLRSGGHL